MSSKDLGNRQWVLLASMLCLGLPCVLQASTDASDPTRPPGTRASEHGTTIAKAVHRKHRFSLSSILIADDRRSAIIDKRSVGVGEYVHGGKVVAIEPDHVRLRYHGHTKKLTLQLENIKHPVGLNPDPGQH